MTEPLSAALAAARAVGFPADDPVVVRDLTNVLVHLRPAPVVARVTLTLARRGVPALESELAFAAAASERGAPIVPPAFDTVVEQDGLHVTFWRYVEHRAVEPDDLPAVGRTLRALHEAVADLELTLPRFDRLDEAEAVAAQLEHPEAPLIRSAVSAAREGLAALTLAEQPVHGDAHVNNVLITDDGPLWSDLENVCRGPVEYDLACLLWRTRVHGSVDTAPALEAYGPHDPELVEALLPVLAAFLVPWNTLMMQRVGRADDPYLRQRIEYLRTFG